jgi:hypothetical protein
MVPLRHQFVPTSLVCLASLVVGLAEVSPATARTIVGDISDETWTPADNPYVIEAMVRAQSLTIQAGTTVRFAAAAPDAAPFTGGLSGLFVGERFTVNGTAAEPVVFEAETNKVKGAWWGISVPSPTSLKASITGAIIRHAKTASCAETRSRPSKADREQLQAALR